MLTGVLVNPHNGLLVCRAVGSGPSDQPSMYAGSMPHQRDPDWAILAPELWQRVYQAAREQMPYERWCQLAATASVACKSLHAALLGHGSAELWRHPHFSSSYPSLSPTATRGLNAMLTRQGRHAHSVSLEGGSWLANELQEVVSSLTSVRDHVGISYFQSDVEVACASLLLQRQPISSLRLTGSECPTLPSSTKQLVVDDESGQYLRRAYTEKLLQKLQPLCKLTSLKLHIPSWLLTAADLLNLCAWYPELQHLQLSLQCRDLQGCWHKRVLSALSHIASRVQLVLVLHADPEHGCDELEHTLAQLAGIYVRTLYILFWGSNKFDETLLAQCSMRELVLCCSDPKWRLQEPPDGVPVVYKCLQHHSTDCWSWLL